MKKIQKLLFVVAIIMSCGVSASAQIYVSIRPARPVYVRTVAPGPEYIWIEEDWNGVGDRYEWRGGYWAAPPQRGYRYKQGHWSHSSRGDHWTPGRWNNGNNYRGNNGNNGKGHHKGNGNNGKHGHNKHGNGHGKH